MIVERFRRAHPTVTGPAGENIPVVCMQMPSEPSALRFYTALLSAIGVPLRPQRRLPESERLALSLLREVGVRMLVIDEIHNVLAGRGEKRREFLNLLRFLGNELHIPLVGVGTREAYLAVRSDDQLENRFEPFILPLWEVGDEARSLLASFAASFPLRRPSLIDTEDMTRYLLATATAAASAPRSAPPRPPSNGTRSTGSPTNWTPTGPSSATTPTVTRPSPPTTQAERQPTSTRTGSAPSAPSPTQPEPSHQPAPGNPMDGPGPQARTTRTPRRWAGSANIRTPPD